MRECNGNAARWLSLQDGGARLACGCALGKSQRFDDEPRTDLAREVEERHGDLRGVVAAVKDGDGRQRNVRG